MISNLSNIHKRDFKSVRQSLMIGQEVMTIAFTLNGETRVIASETDWDHHPYLDDNAK